MADRIRKIAMAKPRGIILRAKELSEEDYSALAATAYEICRAVSARLILHSHPNVARELGADALHMPLFMLRGMSGKEKEGYSVLGASCHSVTDAIEAEKSGCTYITAGHIFETDCKRGLPGRGLEFLRAVCESVSIPVYAIGGITAENIGAVRAAGAAGACIMSGVMKCDDVKGYLKGYDI